MGEAEYVPITALSRHLKTRQPHPSGASLCKQAGAGTEVSEEGVPSLSQENTSNWCCSPGTGKGLGFGTAWDQETTQNVGCFPGDRASVAPAPLGWLGPAGEELPGRLPGLGLMETCPGEVERG